MKHASDGLVALATAKQHTAAQLDIELYDRKIPVKYCIEVVRFQDEDFNVLHLILRDDEHSVGRSRFAEIRNTLIAKGRISRRSYVQTEVP